jgi:hypothetical protein
LKLLLFLFFTVLSLQLLSNYHKKQQAARRIQYAGLFNALERGQSGENIPLQVRRQYSDVLCFLRAQFISSA